MTGVVATCRELKGLMGYGAETSALERLCGLTPPRGLHKSAGVGRAPGGPGKTEHILFWSQGARQP